MKIAHIGLAAYYTDGMTYQDNYLTEQNARDGHEVLYISNAEKYENGAIVETGHEDSTLACGARLVRLPYVRILGKFFSQKFRKVRGLYALLEDFAPDVILSHDLCYRSVLDVIRYKKVHPAVRLYADTHTAYDNSGTNWPSLHILHGIYYKWLVRKSLPHLEKYFYIGEGERIFSREVYGVPESLMEYYPLGGILPTDEEYDRRRKTRRAELGLAEDTPLLLHAGKLEAKKRTEGLLRAFAAVPELKARLAVIGSIPEDMKPVLLPLMEADERVTYLGWKSGAELQEYLCAADLYCQPGKVSAIYQNALCCRCGAMLYPHLYYTKDYVFGQNLWVQSQQDMEAVFRRIAAGELSTQALREGAVRCAEELLDYRALAARLYQ